MTTTKAKRKPAKALQASTSQVKTSKLSRRQREEAAQREEDKRIMFWVDWTSAAGAGCRGS
jgi:hypothetical protein